MFYIVVIFLYLGALIVVGAWHARRIKSQEDFAVAGRSLTVPILVGTMLTTWIGTGSLMGNAEKTYEIGIAFIVVPIGSVLGIMLIAMVAARVRRFGQITVLDILETRYGVVPRLLGTVAIVTAYLVIVSYQYRAGGAVLHRINEDIPLSLCIQIAAGFIIVYTVLAGLVSVARTDVVNGVIMVAGIAFALPWLFAKAGGFAGLTEAFADTPEKMQVFGPIGWLKLIGYSLPAFLLVMGEANLYQRFFAARNPRSAQTAAIILVFAVAIVEVAIILTAWVASALVPLDDNYGHVLLIAAKDLLPAAVGALMLAAAVAIIVSTADSFLLVVSTSVVRDIYHRFLNPNASPKRLVFASRLAVIALGLIAYGVSLTSDQFLEVALWAYTVYGASITPALIATFFWKRATSSAAAASIACGTVVTITWSLLQKYDVFADSAWQNVDAVIPAITASILALVVISLLTHKPDPSCWAPFTKESPLPNRPPQADKGAARLADT
ncbi:MAG: sodium:solute symporter family protein [Planctomycetes bacterium]|nr:sodium:solute symporter family protein [Planctomycetota bacterium]